MGLADCAVRESHQRIESAIRALNLHWPGNPVVINMASAGIRNEGSANDLPLVIGYLATDEKVAIQTLF